MTNSVLLTRILPTETTDHQQGLPQPHACLDSTICAPPGKLPHALNFSDVFKVSITSEWFELVLQVKLLSSQSRQVDPKIRTYGIFLNCFADLVDFV